MKSWILKENEVLFSCNKIFFSTTFSTSLFPLFSSESSIVDDCNPVLLVLFLENLGLCQARENNKDTCQRGQFQFQLVLRKIFRISIAIIPPIRRLELRINITTKI